MGHASVHEGSYGHHGLRRGASQNAETGCHGSGRCWGLVQCANGSKLLKGLSSVWDGLLLGVVYGYVRSPAELLVTLLRARNDVVTRSGANRARMNAGPVKRSTGSPILSQPPGQMGMWV